MTWPRFDISYMPHAAVKEFHFGSDLSGLLDWRSQHFKEKEIVLAFTFKTQLFGQIMIRFDNKKIKDLLEHKVNKSKSPG